MSARRRKVIVGALVVGFVALLFFGQDVVGSYSGVAVMFAAFVAGFAWLWLLVAPWAIEGRKREGRGRDAGAR